METITPFLPLELTHNDLKETSLGRRDTLFFWGNARRKLDVLLTFEMIVSELFTVITNPALWVFPDH
jgi:hypothetical protein